MKTFLKMIVFMTVICCAFMSLGYTITELSGGGGGTVVIEGVSAEAGEAIYWGKGKCSTCHSVGNRGSAIRGPNHGETKKFSLAMGARAAERAKEISKKRGIKFTATDYLIESLVDPRAYVVEGFKGEMPVIYKPPIALTEDEIKAVIMYLQSLGGEVDLAAIKLPDVVKEAASQGGAAVKWEPYMEGDPEAGEYLFFDLESNAACAKCHTVKGKGGKVGPNLSNVAGTRTPQFIIESILDPSAEIASGFEPVLVVTKKMQFITGIDKGEEDGFVKLMNDKGSIVKINKDDIKKKALQKTSIMPGNFKEILTMEDFHNIYAYLQTLK